DSEWIGARAFTDIINDLGSSFRYIEPVNLAVPEPATIALTSFLIAGALGYSWYRRRETQKLLQRNC
ncbi:MAG TPA: PEP-CTERM sorting domain-containing protein, partial [Gemmatales bacterium]|nr:PEP-CTERM sorting domain-containing protein [Gemmatales bacterium]